MYEMNRQLEPTRSRPPIVKRAFAGLVLLGVAAFAVIAVIHIVVTIFWIIAVVAVIAAVIWALNTVL